ncbi:uncharacterized protein BX663DRAFT_516556 [Cokeromyces recurvatus]|uniref:uncharacterized protein n=1 Tax=Cokeromyces recurvatus TaxID=90255 RepID=UPI00221EE5AC|nr:uncharacterized protein BX663DRAFT_516556 [Cokeromyces recurvatus]KAI7900794.1 hypothetical protein BX663DRAFT_516556 [Cokeromyces recurvatus]
MYGVKGTYTILNSVTRQGMLTKQLVAPKSTAFLVNLPTRQVSAGKLSYTTRSQPQYNQKQDQLDASNNTSNVAISQSKKGPLETMTCNSLKAFYDTLKPVDSAFVDARILQAAEQKDAKAVIETFVKGKLAIGQKPLSMKTYEAVIKAYGRLQRVNQPLTPMLDAYQAIVATGVHPSSQIYAHLIRSLCRRDSEVQKTIGMLRRQMARTGNQVDNLSDLENEKNIEKALDLFNIAVKEKCTQAFDTGLYNTLLRGLSFNGNTKDGIYIYEHLESARNAHPDSTTFATLITLFGSAGDLPSVHECFKEYKLLRNKLPNHDPAIVYNAYVHAHTDTGDLLGALDILEKVMIQDKVNISILPYNKIIRRAYFDGKMEMADSIVNRLETDPRLPKPNANTYGIVLSTYSRLQNFDKARETYKTMLKFDISKEYGHIADYAYACTANNMPDEALSVTKDMISRGLELDTNLSQKLVMSFVNNNRIDDAVSALQYVIKMYSKTNFLSERNPVSVLAMDITLKCNNIHNALSILRLLSVYSVHPTPVVCNAVYKLYNEAKMDPDQWKVLSRNMDKDSFFMLYDVVFRKKNTPEEFCKHALDLLKDMNDLKIPPSSSLYVRVLTRMKKYNAKEYEERWEKEFAPFISSVQNQPKSTNDSTETISDSPSNANFSMTSDSDLLSGIALDAALDDKFDEAIDILKNKVINQGHTPTPEAIRDMIQYSTRLGRLNTAQEIFNTVIDSINNLDKNRRYRAYQAIYTAMLTAHARNNDIDSARIFYNKLRQHDMYPDADAYGSLLACPNNSTTDESTDALTIYEEVKKNNVRPTVYFYNVVISKLAKCRKLDIVLNLFDEMKQQGLVPNSITYASVISACIRRGSESNATRYFHEMISAPRYQPRIGAFNAMIQFYVQQKPDREKALKYYNMLNQYNLKPSAHTYRLLMEAYANIPAYDMLTAHKLLSEMNKCHGIQPNTSHYATLIRSYGCLHRDVQSALAVYREMQKTGIEADETVYQALLNTYIDNNEMQHAEELYNNMLKDGKQSSPYIENIFITGYGTQGQLDKAEERFFNMSDDSNGLTKEPSTYEAMVTAYIKNGQKEKADKIIEQMRSRGFPPKIVDGVAQIIDSAS